MRPATNQEHKKRRDKLMGMMSPGSVAVIPGANPARRNRDVHYLFRQDSDFFYLTGFVEPDAVLVLLPGRSQGQEILFCAEREPRAELYDGAVLGPERAAQTLIMDDAFPTSDVDDILPGLLEGRERIYINLGEYPDFDQRLLGIVASIRKRESGGARPPGEFVELKHLLHEMRLFKSDKELKLMRQAANISNAAHTRAMQSVAPGMTEGELEAELTYAFMRAGARFPAYPSIVGAGNNACVLHYVDNAATVQDGDLVLIDAGCEYEHYAADITRTFPANGKFSTAQAQIYDIVLAANIAAINACRPGASFNAPHDAALDVMVDGLVQLGFLSGDRQTLIDSEAYRVFCPHKTSHWLGLDVHDVGDYRIGGEWRELQPGMVLTIEPGIYIPRSELTSHVPEVFRGLGIRIEDDILITADGNEVLTAEVPKSRDAIEALMNPGNKQNSAGSSAL